VTVVSSPAGDFPEMVPFNASLLVTRAGFCEKKPELCRQVVSGVKKALVLMHDRPDEATAVLKKRFDKTEPEVVDETFKMLLERTPRTPIVQESGFTRVQEYMLTSGTLQPAEKLASFAALYSNDYSK
jgi:NitT/TauT family transport system substrate-binding protein